MITTHVLDTRAAARPPASTVVLEVRHGESNGVPIGRGRTDDAAGLTTLMRTAADDRRATYRLTFDTGAYHRDHGIATPFFPEVQVVFDVADAPEHYHVPLLLSPFGYIDVSRTRSSCHGQMLTLESLRQVAHPSGQGAPFAGPRAARDSSI